MFRIVKDVMYTQAYGAWLCIHIGTTALCIGKRRGYAVRLELFTPYHKFRVRFQ